MAMSMRYRSNDSRCSEDMSHRLPAERASVHMMNLMHAAMLWAVGVSLVILYLHMMVLTDSIGNGKNRAYPGPQIALEMLHQKFGQCLAVNAFGLTVTQLDQCQVRLGFPSDTRPKYHQKDPTTGELEGLDHDFNLCQVVSVWEQIRNSSTILTREYIEALPDGWHTYAWQRINKGEQLKKCENVSLCMEKLAHVLPEFPPFQPHQYGRCAVVGNSGDLLVTEFGREIDSHDAVIRNNGAQTQGYSVHVGEKSTFRLLNRGSAKALDKVVELTGNRKEVMIIKSTIHDVMSKLIQALVLLGFVKLLQEVPIRNPVYLLLGMHFGAAAKGTGLKALEFALSVCDTVDMYGFTVDPGYTNWTRYFSESRDGHAPLQARAYYHMMECLGLVTIHSPLRDQRGHKVTEVPNDAILINARIASNSVLNKLPGESSDRFSSCSIWARRPSQSQDRRVSMYPLPQSSANRMLCVRSDDST